MKTYLEPKDIKLMEGAATCLRDRLLVRILFRLGCRVSEALALKVEDVGFAQHTVTIQHLKKPFKVILLQLRSKARPEAWEHLGLSL